MEGSSSRGAASWLPRGHISLMLSPCCLLLLQADLKELWADAYDAWRNVPGHPEKTVYLMPEPSNKALLANKEIPPLPEAVRGAVLFGLTSWNPGGQDAPMEQNLSSYRSIQADLLALKPSCMWQSFGFDLQGYRENGFTVAFPAEAAESSRSAVVEIAKKYGQGAIYEFRAAEPISEGRIVRSTVPALLQEVDADVTMIACSKPDTSGADPDLHFEGSLPWPPE